MPAPRRTALLGTALLVAMAWIYRPLLAGEVIAGRDAFRFFFPAYAFIAQALGEGTLPLWNPYLRLGQPFAAALITQGFYPSAWIAAVVFGPVKGYLATHLVHVALAAVGTFRLARHLRLGTAASGVAAATFALSPLFTDLAGHRNVVDAAAWTGFLLVAAMRLGEGPSLARAGRLAALATLAFLAGSPETVVWQALLALAVIIVARRSPGMGRVAPWALGAGLWTVLLSAFALLPAAELARASGRAGPFHQPLEWSASPPQLLAMSWPRADLPRGEYWGDDQWWMVTVFLGSVPGLLALAGLSLRRRVLPFALAGAVLALLALGKHFAPSAFLLSHGPLSAFRFPAKYLVGVAFCLAVLAGSGLDVLAVRVRRLDARWRLTFVQLGAALAALLLLPPLFRVLAARRGLTEGLPWFVCAALLLALVATHLRGPRLRWALLGVFAAELTLHHALNAPFGWERPVRLGQPSALAAAIPPGFSGRISVPLSDTLVRHAGPSFIDTSRDALIPNRSVEERLRALEGYGAPEPWVLDHFQHAGHRAVFDLAGVEYFVRLGPPPFDDLEQVASAGGAHLYRSRTAFPRAFLVHRAEQVDPLTALERARDPRGLTRDTVFLEEPAAALGVRCEGSTATLRHEGLHEVVVAVNACGEGYLVLTDSFFDGWRASLDGARARLLRANGALRAVRVPPGVHTVRFEYAPGTFRLGAALTLGALAAWLAVEARTRRAARRARRTAPGPAPEGEGRG